ncbi:MAG: bifunctional phosphoribosylaminoimidazolecarboxamide formyltransferase/IMP cyclohydrolase [Candidatus Eisenbacteria bacterium]|nr:bifunctional phosphoribosylaminoimidazolecarboxamide formyltransferase/IMP cyclohydrolase [Candidatus Eisenbacteria bacterium]
MNDSPLPDVPPRPVRRALLSTYDKTGIDDLARCLASFGCELISSGGTRDYLAAAGIPTTDVSAVTGNPAAFDGRMKTISFSLASSLLFHRERHAEEAARLGVQPIDMVVCTFYPFGSAAARGLDLDGLVEYIDIGGPTMVRAAAKNARFVAVVCDPRDYPAIIQELQRQNGALTLETRLALMRTAFALSADYESDITTALDSLAGRMTMRLALEGGRAPRYGENPHQRAMVYRVRGASHALCDCQVLHGKELSFNNLVDMQRALEAVRDLGAHAVSVVKHTNPCGMATAGDQRQAFELAWEGDPVSAFGSVVAFNTPVSRPTVEFLELTSPDRARRKFLEVIAAPAFDDEALGYLTSHPNLRVVVTPPENLAASREMRLAMHTALVQDADGSLCNELRTVGGVSRDLDRPLIEFALVAVRQIASNGIAVARRLPGGACQLMGMGCGQPNRVCSIELALSKCRENLARECPDPVAQADYVRDQLGCAVLVSDGFFPFPDNVDACARAGIRLVVQPGGSMRDAAVIQRADNHGVAMVFSGIRHFRH